MSYSSVHRAFERQCLRAHNRYRALHGCLPLILNQRLIDGANEWAQELSNYDSPWHTTNPCLGENIYVTRAVHFKGDVPVTVWYDEICNYDFETTRGFLKAGHFTQVIWKTTERMGVGFARSGRTTIVVARYHPPGNILGEYCFNVPPELIFYESDYTEDDLTSTEDSISKTSRQSGNKSIDRNRKSQESKEREKTKSSGKSRKSTSSVKSGESAKTDASEKSGKTGNAEKSGKKGESSKTGESEKAGSSKEASKTKDTAKTEETKDPDESKDTDKSKSGDPKKSDKSK